MPEAALPPFETASVPPLSTVAVSVDPDETVTEPPPSTVALKRSEIFEVVPPAPTLTLVKLVNGFNATLTPPLTVRPTSSRWAPGDTKSDTLAPTQKICVPRIGVPDVGFITVPPEETIWTPPTPTVSALTTPPERTVCTPPLWTPKAPPAPGYVSVPATVSEPPAVTVVPLA